MAFLILHKITPDVTLFQDLVAHSRAATQLVMSPLSGASQTYFLLAKALL
jgi:hypothetical protein